MLRTSFVPFLLASAAICTACGGGSKSSNTHTTPVASAPEATTPESATPPAAMPGETAPEVAATPPGTPVESGTSGSQTEQSYGTGTTATGQTGSTDTSAERENVSGTTSGAETGTGAGMGTDSNADKSADKAIGEPQIIAALIAANQGEIDAGKLALKHARSKDVKSFARMMVTDHGKMLADVKTTAKAIKIQPEDSDDVKTMKSDADAARAKLEGLKGAEFDRAYVDMMVEDHQKDVDELETKLGPAASSNPKLANLIDKAKPKVAMHLEHAKKLQEKISSK